MWKAIENLMDRVLVPIALSLILWWCIAKIFF